MLAATQPRMKSPEAFRTISEVSDDLDVPQHVLRFWESRFAHVRPVKRAGGRRYYRPEDVDLLRGIRSLLYSDGYTIKGVQKILRDRGLRHVAEIGRGEAKAVAPGDIETPESEPFDVAEMTADESAGISNEGEEPTFARAQIALLERAHAEPEAVAEEPPIVEAVGALETAVPETPVLEMDVQQTSAAVGEPSLSGEQRVQLEFLLAEMLSLKKRLAASRG